MLDYVIALSGVIARMRSLEVLPKQYVADTSLSDHCPVCFLWKGGKVTILSRAD